MLEAIFAINIIAIIFVLFLIIGKALRQREKRQFEWHKSGQGNLTCTRLNKRLTVFPSDDGWKYCIADTRLDNPEFSDVYKTSEDARLASLEELKRQIQSPQQNP